MRVKAAKNGQPAADTIPFRLHWIYWLTSINQDKEFLAGKAAASKILATLYPGYNPDDPPFINATDTREQKDLIEGLSGVRGGRLDEAVARIFRSLDLGRYEGFNRVTADDLALACMDRLIGKGMDKEFEAYCETRIRELKLRRREIAEDQRPDLLGERLQRIRKGMKNPE